MSETTRSLIYWLTRSQAGTGSRFSLANPERSWTMFRFSLNRAILKHQMDKLLQESGRNSAIFLKPYCVELAQ